MPQLPILKNMNRFGEKTAITDSEGDCSYRELLDMSLRAARSLLELSSGGRDLSEERVAFMFPKNREYAAIKLAVWRAGGVSVPLCCSHPAKETEYVIDDSSPLAVVSHRCFSETTEKICSDRGIRFVSGDEVFSSGPPPRLPDVSLSRRAMIIYTSGTTSRPKGVVTTHFNIDAQIRAMIEAWEWSGSDSVLNVLPLHHLHGILNLLLCPLYAGAACEMAEFEPRAVWNRFVRGGITVFMAVPTVYAKLAEFWEEASTDEKKAMSDACAAMRLMVSGSAALTVKLSRKWRDISGHTLLERYGMTETGMILSNPLAGERKPGFVGKPMPGVEAGIFDERGGVADTGEIRVRGDGVFLEYWKKPEATRRAFSGGRFRTGDIAVRDSEGDFRILGRDSVDIIKSGGYKISALEVEREIMEKAGVKQCAVVGVEDEIWGRKVAAVVVPEDGRSFSLDELREWLKPRLARYKIPSVLKIADRLPENSLGKVEKNALSRSLESGE